MKHKIFPKKSKLFCKKVLTSPGECVILQSEREKKGTQDNDQDSERTHRNVRSYLRQRY
jgi:hypothetical protein